MMDRTSACLVLNIPANTTDLETIKKAYRKKALECHPDKTRDNNNASFQELNKAFSFLTTPDDPNAQAELTFSWLNIVQSELNTNNQTNTIATPDQHKPTIDGFFLSLRRKLIKLEEKLKDAEPDELIAKFEGISLQKQTEHHKYTTSSIITTHRIISLLQDYIKTSNPDHWKIKEDVRKATLAYQLYNEFKKFGDDQQLKIAEAYSFELAQILLNHLAYLRNPLDNFKSTEDRYHLILLSDVSDHIRNYHNEMLKQIDRFHERITVTGGFISEQIMKLSSRAQKLKWDQEGGVVADYAKLSAELKEEIYSAKDYVLNHCYYPDNVNIFNPEKDKKTHQFGIAGSRRRDVICAMFRFNEIPGATHFSIEDEIGYPSIEEYENETHEILRNAKENNLAADQIKQTGPKFVATNKKLKPILSIEGSDTTQQEEQKQIAIINPNPMSEIDPKVEQINNNSSFLPKLTNRETEILEKTKHLDDLNLINQYMSAESALSASIIKISDSIIADSARQILSQVKSSLDYSKNLSKKDIAELTTVLIDTKLATRNDRTQKDIDTFHETANTVSGKPKYRALSISMMVLGILLIPVGVLITLVTLIPTFGAGAIVGDSLIGGGVSLFLLGKTLFSHGRRKDISKVMHDAESPLKLAAPAR